MRIISEIQKTTIKQHSIEDNDHRVLGPPSGTHGQLYQEHHVPSAYCQVITW